MIDNSNFEIFLNCENKDTVAQYIDMYPFIAGVTTNPIMIARLGRTDYLNILKEMREVIGTRKLFSQVTSRTTKEIIEEAKMIRAAGGENTIVKVPGFEYGLKAITELREEGIHTCATLCLSTIQGCLALEAGADYVVPFYFHMDNDGIDPVAVTDQLVKFTKVLGRGKVMTAAHRNLEQFGTCLGLGVQACTLNPGYITEGMTNDAATKNLEEFMGGWAKVFGDTKIIDMK